MNARETFEALLAGKRVKSKHPASKYCYLDEDGVLLCDDGVPADYFLTVNDRELYQEPNPFLVGI